MRMSPQELLFWILACIVVLCLYIGYMQLSLHGIPAW
jgi:hypothetical protein